MSVDPDYGEKGDTLRVSLLIRYFGKYPLPKLKSPNQTSSTNVVSHGPGAKYIQRAQMTLHDVQCHLDSQGTSSLIVDLVIKSSSSSLTMPKIFNEVIELGNSLLEGGNQEIQRSLYDLLHSGEVSQNFFKVFHEKMCDAQIEIKSTVSVNTNDVATRTNEDDRVVNPRDIAKPTFLRRGSKGGPSIGGLVMTEELREELGAAAIATHQAYMASRGANAGKEEQ